MAAKVGVYAHGRRFRIRWRDDTGRQLYESYDTEPDARAAAARVEAQTAADGAAPLAVPGSVPTLAQWWARWEPGRPWRTSTRDAHGYHWRKYICPVFGHTPVDTITTSDVERFHRALERRGLAPNTVAAVHRTLSMALGGAERDRVVDRNVARVARMRRRPKAQPVALSDDELERFLDALGATQPRLVAFAHVCATAGLRRAEAAGLTWDRVDLGRLVIVVDRQIDWTASSLAWSDTKTGEAREVAITAALGAELRRHRSEYGLGTGGLVFTNQRGAPWPRNTLADAWRRAAGVLAAANAPLPPGARGWHALRHGCASRLLTAGVPPAEAAAMLGHTPATLLSVYAHVVDRAAADDRIRAALDAR